MAHVLVATLGDSPIVVTSMYDLLKDSLIKQQEPPIERVIVLYPTGHNRKTGRDIIEDALAGECTITPYELPFEDAYDEKCCVLFLSQLIAILYACQQQGDMVHLSLAGGRKNMAAITAIVAPLFYRNIKGLYHVIDKRENTSNESFKSIQELEDLYYAENTTRLREAMHPALENLNLVSIPLQNVYPAPESYVQMVLNMTVEQLLKYEEKHPDEAPLVRAIRNEPRLSVYLTERARKEFEKLGGGSREQNFRRCFSGMRDPNHLVKEIHPKLTLRSEYYPMHFYKGGGDAERPLFHTEPDDIVNYPNSDVKKVVVERLAIHRNKDTYEPEIKQLERTTYRGEEETLHLIDTIYSEMLTKAQAARQRDPSTLIVPMGTVPMVATQLYTLLSERENRDIQEVILLYPGGADSVITAVRIAKDAFEFEGIKCTKKPIQELADIASTKDCETYQKALEQIIVDARQQHPDCHIDLALSGGRKGMAAMALFAAQRTQLREVYHTLIADEALDSRVEDNTQGKAFDEKTQEQINDHLFLHAYAAQKEAFRLFKVPMGPLHG